jgi:glycolate oxidase iron-sulfur subunit
MDLGLDADELNTCVQCGLCLPHCPTYRVTGDEALSPRGRIQLMREVQLHDAPLSEQVVEAFETCVQCRGCEPACPSSVPYGRLMEQTRAALAVRRLTAPRWQRLALRGLNKPQLLALSRPVLAVAQRMRLVPKRFGIPAGLPVRDRPLTASGRDVVLYTGCVMNAWQRSVHRAAQRVLEAAGFGVTPTNALGACCGALHAHAGLADQAKRLAATMIAEVPGDMPILVDSAGCGAMMKDYGHLLGTPEAAAFAGRVFDIHEWLAQRLDRLPAAAPLDMRVAVQDPCHLRHVQRVHTATRDVLRPFVREVVELDDDGLCCGAGGMYSVLEPELAGQIRDRKLASIDRAAPDVVASANPGCSMHLAARDVAVVHPMELIDRALRRRT